MPENLIVTIAPISGVALIQIPGGDLYSLRKDGEVKIEHAPQMFNLHLDASCHMVEMEDEYPFEKVRSKLEEYSSKGILVHLLVSIMDTELDDEYRHSCVERATKIVEKHPDTMEFTRKIMLECELSAQAEIKDEFISKLPQPLQDLFQEMIVKWRS